MAPLRLLPTASPTSRLSLLPPVAKALPFLAQAPPGHPMPRGARGSIASSSSAAVKRGALRRCGLHPAYVMAAAAVSVARPEAFRWFVAMAPGSYTLVLGFIMIAMGLTLELREFLALLRARPLSILFGCAAQYTIMPAFGAIVSRVLGLPPSLSVGLILLGCCPGGTASNVESCVSLH